MIACNISYNIQSYCLLFILEKIQMTSLRLYFDNLLLVLLFASIAQLSLASSKVPVQECPKIEEYDISGEPPEIKYEQKHLRTVLAYLESLNYFHYKKIKYNDDFSRQFLDNYLERLDPNKAFLLQTDIKLIKERYEEMMDDHFRQIDLKPLISIFTWYRSRAINQLTKNINILSDNRHNFDFNSDKTFLIDRESYDWHKDYLSVTEYWNNRLILELLNLKLSGDDEQTARKKLARRYKSQLSYLKQEKPIQALETYLNVLGGMYDPHTNYFSPQVSENFEIGISLSLEGIGAVLQTQGEFTKVVRIVPGGPADLEGTLQPDDRIVNVAEGDLCEPVDVVGLRIQDVVKYIRGSKGSKVKLTIIPAEYEDMSETREVVTITRDKVKLEDNAAQSDIIEVKGEFDQEFKLGVIDLPSFYVDNAALQRGERDYRSTTRDVRNLIIELQKQEIDGLIIDLRQNGGGSLSEVVSLTDLFIDAGPVVQTKGSRYRNVGSQRARSKSFYMGPLVVLIDRLSASASEIFSAAIQDYGRGIIVGSQSFGKGTVQAIRPLPFGQAKITESKFYRVSGGSTQLEGVYPDIFLPQLFNADDIGESALDNPLQWDTVRPIAHRHANLKADIEALNKKHQKRLKFNIGLQYLQNQIELDRELRDIEFISLNENKRIKFREDFEKRTVNNENNWRRAMGFPIKPPKKTDKEENSSLLDNDKETVVLVASENQESEDAENKDNEEIELPDVLLNETGNILADWIQLMDSKNLRNQASNRSTAKNNANYQL